jgi:hypothetical protein
MANQTQPTFAITVNDVSLNPCASSLLTIGHVQTQPIWVFCQQTGHCGKGMVFAVNCGADGSQNSFTNFKNAALAQGAAAASSAGYPGAPTATASGGATPSATTGPQVHTVIVGGANGDVFTPSSISAQPNDIVTFELWVMELTDK